MAKFEKYLQFKIDVLICILSAFPKEESNLTFVRDIDRWDWEIESALEGVNALKKVQLLSFSANKRAKVRAKNEDTSLLDSAKQLVKIWNELISLASITYAALSEEEKLHLFTIEIDFEIYLKELLI